MFPKKLQMRINKRNNVHVPGGEEYAVDVRLDDGNWWTVTTYESDPQDKVDQIYDIVRRSMEAYHRSLSIPGFCVEL